MRYHKTMLCAGAGALLTAAISPQLVAQGGESPVTTAREQTVNQQVAHVLSRLTFGARPHDAELVGRMGVDAWIDQQLHPELLDDRPVTLIEAGQGTAQLSTQEILLKYPNPGSTQTYIRWSGRPNGPPRLSTADSIAWTMRSREAAATVRRELDGGRIARALVSERQLQEVVTDFWLNHFSIDQNKRNGFFRLPEFERDVRKLALGKFRTLLSVAAKSPAMLTYLDNWENDAEPGRPRLAKLSETLPVGLVAQQFITAESTSRFFSLRPRALPAGVSQELVVQINHASARFGLNENYGRELLELHTLGSAGGYTQADVLNVARAFTGWTTGYSDFYESNANGSGIGGGQTFVFVRGSHDAGEKVVLGHQFPAGRGIEDGEDVLDILARHPATAHYVAFKLARRFVSDVPPEALVMRAAATFTRTDGDIREVVRTIVTSPEFFSTAAYRSKVKSPFELVVSALRALGAQPDTGTQAIEVITALGQPIYGRATPDGWPETGSAWLNAGAILRRMNLGLLIGSNAFAGASPTAWPGLARLIDAPRDRQVDGVVAALLGGHATPATRDILTRGESRYAARDGSAMPGRMTVASATPTIDASVPMTAMPLRTPRDALDASLLPPPRGLALLVGLAIGSPEFQRR